MRLLFELLGEHQTMPRAEVLACIEAEGSNYEVLEEGLSFCNPAGNEVQVVDLYYQESEGSLYQKEYEDIKANVYKADIIDFYCATIA